ncbi:hypothetical protein [Ralstonia sp. RL]|uniref:hypothetical protein n=1 Tax=Ralstonia sp. RL TaxID=1839756 RepID=UPI00257D613C|nr:hypothetical protein [Ralstonia sp. RL]
MKLRLSRVLPTATFMAFCITAHTYAADDLDRQQKALNIISDFADKLCKDVPLKHEASKIELTTTAKAELKGVARKVAGLGFDGAAKYTDSKESGFLEQDLANVVAGNRDCRLQVWNDLKGKLISRPLPSTPSTKQKSTTKPLPPPSSIIEDRIKEILQAEKEAASIDLRPKLMTAVETEETLQKMNKESVVYDTTINLPVLHRYIREYGKTKTKDELGKKINAYANKNKELTGYLGSLMGRFNGEERLNDVNYVNEIYERTVQLLNERSSARSDLLTFIANLKNSDFIGYD